MKNLLAVLLVLLAIVPSSYSQSLTERLNGLSDSTSKKSYFIPLPAVAYAQETGWQFGLVTLNSFYTDKQNPLQRSSTVSGLASITTKKQSNLVIRPDVWSPGNRYHYTADLKYRNFPFNFYGVGNKTRKADQDVLTQKLLRIAGEAEKHFKSGIYLGVAASFEHYSYTDKDSGGIYSSASNLQDRDGGSVLFLGLSQIIDSRNTNTYTTQGTYIKFNYSYAPNFFGGENYSGSFFKVDFRTFKSYSEKAVLGFNLNFQTLEDNQTPFYLLPQLGNDQVMRGYYTGRYRDQNLLALQTEYRYRFMKQLGVVAFGGLGSVYSAKGFAFDKFKPSYGAGMRYFVNPARGTTLRLDYAFGEKRAEEKRQQGFYLSFGEAF